MMERSERGSWSWYLLEGKIIDLVGGLMIMGRIRSWSGVGDHGICKHFVVRIRHLRGFKSHKSGNIVTSNGQRMDGSW